MKAKDLFFSFSQPQRHLLALLFTTLSTTLFSAGCATSGNLQGSQGQNFSGNTNVTVLLSSTANDQLTEFDLTFNSITLTKKSGATVTLLSNPQGAEFIHLNGTAEPLATISIPQGIYTSATADIGYSAFTCVTLIPPTDPNSPGSLLTATFAYGATPSSNVSVSLPTPVTVTGNSLGLLFNMEVTQSASFGSCYSPPGSFANYSIAPTFTVTPVTSALETGLNGEIASIDAASNSVTLTMSDGQSLSLTANNSTAFQGIPDFSRLTPGMLVIADATLQSNGTQVAQRIAVHDANTSNITNLIGPILQSGPSSPTGIGPSALVFGSQSQGFLDSALPGKIGEFPFNLNQASFQIFGVLPNLNNLPFVPSFNGGTLVPGQNVYLTTEAMTLGVPGYPPAATLTLVPQVINATVNSVSTSGSFQDYTASLAPYDLFSTLAVQQGLPVRLTNPSTVEIYVDNNTQRFNKAALAPGNTLRFYGLVFNDNGTLRMDCSQINDGVSLTAQANSSSHPEAAQPRIIHSGSGSVRQLLITRTTR